MNALLLDFLVAIARWALTAAGAALVARHIITADQNDAFLGAIFQHLMIWVPLVASFVLVLWARYRNRVKFLTALSMPVGSTENEVKSLIASGAVTPSVKTPADTIPGTPR